MHGPPKYRLCPDSLSLVISTTTHFTFDKIDLWDNMNSLPLIGKYHIRISMTQRARGFVHLPQMLCYMLFTSRKLFEKEFN
jgi:hypothetical protein